MRYCPRAVVLLLAGVPVACGGTESDREASTFDAAVTVADASADGRGKPRRDAATASPAVDAGTQPCVKSSCEMLAGACGTLRDGCGGTIACECELPLTCGGSGVAGRCGFAPKGLLAAGTASEVFGPENAWRATAVAFSSSGSWVAIGGGPETNDRGGLRVLSAGDLSPASLVMYEAGRVVGLAFKPDADELFYSVRGAPAIKSARLDKGQLLSNISAGGCLEVDAMGFSVNHITQRIGSVGSTLDGKDAIFCEHDFSGLQTQSVRLRDATPFSVAYEPTAGTQLVITDDRRVRITRPSNLTLVGSVSTELYGFAIAYDVAWISDRAVAFALDRSLLIGAVASPSVDLTVSRVALTDSRIVSIATHPAAKTIATLHEDGTLRLFDPETRTEQGRATAHSEVPSALAFSSDGRKLASVGTEPDIALFTLE